MTALEIVRNAYPGIPIAILNQFAELLPAEASAINSEFANTDFRFFHLYKNAVSANAEQNISFVWTPDYNNLAQTIQILNPKNSIYKVSHYSAQEWQVIVILNANTSGVGVRTITSVYDSRIYDEPIFTPGNNIVTFYKQAGPYFSFARNDITVFGKLPLKPFNGIASIYAAIENGISFDADNSKIQEFNTYISAYKKFATQIDAEKNLLEKQAQNTVGGYKQQLDDQAAREYADLQAKKIQLLIAIDNDAKSAQRDFQNMLLTAQGLKNQIGGNLV